ncbi:PepSY-associated TM helix domain-containing protein [Pseudothauera rhizosphaerae]|nr:PepSY-associated TM helix domain-containing protein [Pseudothauera rhizosphaerae]
MKWVHTWTGLPLGWLLFAVYVTGTLSFFHPEITLWMQPESHRAKVAETEETARRAFEALARVAPDAPQWTVSLPGSRSGVAGLAWREATAGQPAGGQQNAVRGEAARRGEGGQGARGEFGERAAGEGVSERGAGGQGDGAAPRRGFGERGMAQGMQARGERGARGAGGRGSEESDAEEAGAAQAGAQTPAASGGGVQGGEGGRGQGMKRATMDPATGELIEPRQTAGGGFLYRFHYRLYGFDRTWGQWIVGAATMVMFIALITGVVIHRTIFRDIFSFRPAKGKRSWMDGHNASSVLSLPFHVVITFSGLLLLGNQLMPSAASSAYPGDERGYFMEMRGMRGGEQQPAARPSGTPAQLADIGPLLAVAQERWPEQGVGSIAVNFPGDARATIELRQARGDGLANRAMGERLLFDGVTGAPLEAPPVADPSGVRATSNVLSAVHLGRFASPLVRWLLFASGVLGSVMVASGLVLWVVSRARDRTADGKIPAGHRFVEVLNVAAVAGLLVAIGAYFWANRLIPAEVAERNLWEIRVFFTVWSLTLLHSLLRRHKQAWIEQLALAGGLLAALPLVNAATGGAHLGVAFYLGQWQVAGFDLCALVCGALLLHAARKVASHVPREKVARSAGRTKKPAAAGGTDEGGDGPVPAVLQTEEA